jgi:hypothetical protein
MPFFAGKLYVSFTLLPMWAAATLRPQCYIEYFPCHFKFIAILETVVALWHEKNMYLADGNAQMYMRRKERFMPHVVGSIVSMENQKII